MMTGRGLRVKVALTVLFAARYTMQRDSSTEVHPFQDAKFESRAGFAVRGNISLPRMGRSRWRRRKCLSACSSPFPVPVPFLTTVSVPTPFAGPAVHR